MIKIMFQGETRAEIEEQMREFLGECRSVFPSPQVLRVTLPPGSCNTDKIGLIKALRNETPIALKEAKDQVEILLQPQGARFLDIRTSSGSALKRLRSAGFAVEEMEQP